MRISLTAGTGLLAGGAALAAAHHLTAGRRDATHDRVIDVPVGERFPMEEGRRVGPDPYPGDGVRQYWTQPASELLRDKSELELLARGATPWPAIGAGVGGAVGAAALGMGTMRLAKALAGRPGIAGLVTTVGMGAAAAALGAGIGGAIGATLGRASYDRANAMTPEAVGEELVGLYDADRSGDLDLDHGNEIPFGSLSYHSNWDIFDTNASPTINEHSRGVQALDADSDGRLTADEVTVHARAADTNGDGVLRSGEAKAFAEQHGLAYWDIPRKLR